jgi:hypothetical protein
MPGCEVSGATADAGGISPMNEPLNIQPYRRLHARHAAFELFSAPSNPNIHFILEWQGGYMDGIGDRPILNDRISIDENGDFDTVKELGEPAFCMAAYDVDHVTVIDIIRWAIRHLEEFACLYGFAGLLGSLAAVDPASFILANAAGCFQVEAGYARWLDPMSALRYSGIRNPITVDVSRHGKGGLQA